MNNRFYLRGTTPLGLFNTLLGAFFNRVLVRCRDVGSGKTIGWKWARADSFPRERRDGVRPN
jgi:hypothetical protein